MAAKVSVLGLTLSSSPYLRCALGDDPELAPTLIQSSSCNVHHKNEALNPMCSTMISDERESVIIHMGVKRGLQTKYWRA